jgi:hypothetical protein
MYYSVHCKYVEMYISGFKKMYIRCTNVLCASLLMVHNFQLIV